MIKIEDIKVGVIVYHRTGVIYKEYTIVDITSKVKINGEWYNAIVYKPNYKNNYTLFIRTVDDFMNNFSLKK